MVGERGFEPPAPASRRQCSTRLSYSPTEPAVRWTPDGNGGVCSRRARGRQAPRGRHAPRAAIIAATSTNFSRGEPARARATVRFHVASGAEPVRVEAYDVLGRRVATLADGAFAPGAHEVAWETSALASGVYFVRLSQGRQSRTVQAVVAR